MKSIIQEAIAKHQENQTLVEEKKPTAPIYANPDDAELAKLAETLKVNIRIVGCGGGGSNTINRCVEEGIQGAEMCAINTDAKHLLTIHSGRKILIGRRTTKGLGQLRQLGIILAAIRRRGRLLLFDQGLVFLVFRDRFLDDGLHRFIPAAFVGRASYALQMHSGEPYINVCVERNLSLNSAEEAGFYDTWDKGFEVLRHFGTRRDLNGRRYPVCWWSRSQEIREKSPLEHLSDQDRQVV